MKHSRRCILILLALQLCATAACGEQTSVETETTTTAEDTTVPELSDNLPDIDMDGFELRISRNGLTANLSRLSKSASPLLSWVET